MNSGKRGLGRGLSALMADVRPETETPGQRQPAAGERQIPVEMIHPNPDQPRRHFDKVELEELAISIKEHGIVQPLIVRALNDGFQIVAGERRWRAAQIAQLHNVPVVVREYSDLDVLEIAIIENIQRADLNPIEEAAGYRQLMDKFGHTQEKLAEALGKSRSYVANLVRLLHLPTDVQALLSEGKLSAGHARALITAENPSELAARIVREGLSVREAERLAAATLSTKKPKARTMPSKDADTIALERDLSANMRMKVSIDHKSGSDNGVVTISYTSMDQLDDICQKLSTTAGSIFD